MPRCRPEAPGTAERQDERAARLRIPIGTAQAHVQNILTKLDLADRAQIGGWLVAHSPERH